MRGSPLYRYAEGQRQQAGRQAGEPLLGRYQATGRLSNPGREGGQEPLAGLHGCLVPGRQAGCLSHLISSHLSVVVLSVLDGLSGLSGGGCG